MHCNILIKSFEYLFILKKRDLNLIFLFFCRSELVQSGTDLWQGAAADPPPSWRHPGDQVQRKRQAITSSLHLSERQGGRLLHPHPAGGELFGLRNGDRSLWSVCFRCCFTCWFFVFFLCLILFWDTPVSFYRPPVSSEVWFGTTSFLCFIRCCMFVSTSSNCCKIIYKWGIDKMISLYVSQNMMH